jgi:hypothetical protein
MPASFPNVRLRILAALFLVSVFVGAQKIETMNGVRVVHNVKGGKWGKNPEASIKLVQTIGDVDSDDGNFVFSLPGDIALDSAGNIYITDNRNCRIQKFGPAGKYLTTFGRKGQGPGEFSEPSSLDIDPNGLIYVLDGIARKIHVLEPDGKEYKAVPLIKFSLETIRLLKSGLLAAKGSIPFRLPGQDEGKDKSVPKLMKIIDMEGNIQKEFGDLFDYGGGFINSYGNSFKFALDKEDNIYLSFSFQNRIEKYYADGRLIWKADRLLNYNSEPLEREKIEIMKGGSKISPPKMNLCSNGIALDKRGRAWVVTLDRQIKKEEIVNTELIIRSGGIASVKTTGNTDLRTTDMYKLEIFAPDGILLGEIPLNHFADSIRIIGDNLFLRDRERGVKYYQYKIIEK